MRFICLVVSVVPVNVLTYFHKALYFINFNYIIKTG